MNPKDAYYVKLFPSGWARFHRLEIVKIITNFALPFPATTRYWTSHNRVHSLRSIIKTSFNKAIHFLIGRCNNPLSQRPITAFFAQTALFVPVGKFDRFNTHLESQYLALHFRDKSDALTFFWFPRILIYSGFPEVRS